MNPHSFHLRQIIMSTERGVLTVMSNEGLTRSEQDLHVMITIQNVETCDLTKHH